MTTGNSDPTDPTTRIVFEYVFPTLGCLFSNLLMLAPTPAVLRLQRNQQLGATNPLPFPLMVGNCVAWTLYSFLQKNHFLFFANSLGCLLSVWYSMVAYSILAVELDRRHQRLPPSTTTTNTHAQKDLKRSPERAETDPRPSFSALSLEDHATQADSSSRVMVHVDVEVEILDDENPGKRRRFLERTKNRVLGLFLAVVLVNLLAGWIAFIVLGGTESQTASLFIGILCVVISFVFIASPLTGLYSVVKLRNAKGIDPYLALATVMNGIFWSIYGFIVLKDPFVYGPNMACTGIGAIQLACIVLFR